jgi:hypothetical protein
MKNSNDTIGNGTRDLPTCSAVPQPTAPPAKVGLNVYIIRVTQSSPIRSAWKQGTALFSAVQNTHDSLRRSSYRSRHTETIQNSQIQLARSLRPRFTRQSFPRASSQRHRICGWENPGVLTPYTLVSVLVAMTNVHVVTTDPSFLVI